MRTLHREDFSIFLLSALVVLIIAFMPAGIILALYFDNPLWLILTAIGLIFGLAG
jgi:hypothetical protein